MSNHDFVASYDVYINDYPFNALIMAAIRQADDDEQRRLRAAFPDVFDELVQRWNASLAKMKEEGRGRETGHR